MKRLLMLGLALVALSLAACSNQGGGHAGEVETRACQAHGGVAVTVGPRLASNGKWVGTVSCDDGTMEVGTAPTKAGPWNHWVVQ